MEILELKHTINKQFSGWTSQQNGEDEGRIDKVENETIEITHSEQQRENREKKKKKDEQSLLCDVEDYNKRLTFMSWKSRKRGEREQVEKIF